MTKIHKYLLVATVIFIIFLGSFFVVDQRQQALVLQFGEAVRVINEPGLKFKIPLIQNVIIFDKRILDLGMREKEVIAVDQKRLIIDAFIKYRINDPLKFYTTVNNEMNARGKLIDILDSSLRRVVGEIPLINLLSAERSSIMSKIKIEVDNETSIFGIEIIDVRIVRGDLPPENSNAIFTRMQTEREKEAKEIRATGFEEAAKIKAFASKQRSIILATSKKDANIIRGRGDAKANRIFANAFSRDPSFFHFYRSMKAYEKSLGGDKDKTKMVVTPGQDFFKFLNN
jgi:membrane protease subunit HflC